VVVALKVDADTAEALESLPNKSAFIREALRARLDALCPLCQGTGRRGSPAGSARGRRHAHALPRARCLDCQREGPLAREARELEPGALALEWERLRHFLSFGDFFCGACWPRSRTCERCGHRTPGSSASHRCP
jgi:hypothetical protein